ncbi:MAG: hypothetical protein EZS28_022555, partial [Streblomastix strix]
HKVSPARRNGIGDTAQNIKSKKDSMSGSGEGGQKNAYDMPRLGNPTNRQLVDMAWRDMTMGDLNKGQGIKQPVYVTQSPISGKGSFNVNQLGQDGYTGPVDSNGEVNANLLLSPAVSKKMTSTTVELTAKFANLGTLFDLIKTQKDVPLPMIRVIMRQILEGLSFIHSKNIIHRDIKGGNIMMHSLPGSGKVILKIADFGEVKQIQNSSQNQMIVSARGTPAYIAPELQLGIGKANVKVDVWSLGMLLYQIVTHTFPFDPLSDKEIGHYPFFVQNKQIPEKRSIKSSIFNRRQYSLESFTENA